MSKRWRWVLVALLACLVLSCGACAVLGVVAVGLGEGWPDLSGGLGDAVAVIPVQGVIMAGRGAGSVESGLVYSDRLIEDLAEAQADPRVRAIVLDVDSPGGSVVGSVDIYNALLECTVPVVTSMGETAASGGYYVACATQYVYARPGTFTGSIGVIMRITHAEELMAKVGIDVQIIKSGPYKDQGGWHRPLSEEEVAMLKTIIDQAYDDFVQVVVAGRGLTDSEVRAVADGRIMTGRQAVAAGLVDAEGDLDDAIAKAAALAGIEGEPRTLRIEHTPSLLDLIGSVPGFVRTSPEERLWRAVQRENAPTLEYLYCAP